MIGLAGIAHDDGGEEGLRAHDDGELEYHK